MPSFGTDGLRGAYPSDDFNASFLARFAMALARWVKAEKSQGNRVLLGLDTRSSGVDIARVLCEVLGAEKLPVTFLGVVPTPAVACLLQEAGKKAILGLAITASHNTARDNGIKCFKAPGLKFSLEDEARLESFLRCTHCPPFSQVYPLPEKVKALRDYHLNLQARIPADSLEGLVVVTDTAQGATYRSTPDFLRSLKVQVHPLGNKPNGRNINYQSGTENPKKLCEKVLEQKADCGVAHDGDGDRVLVVNDQGQVLPGDVLLGLFAQYLANRGQLKQKTVVLNSESNLGLDRSLGEQGIETKRVEKVGDRYILQALLEQGLSFGGESSGHLIFTDLAPRGDGLLSAVLFLHMLQVHKAEWKKWRGHIRLLPERACQVPLRFKKPLKDCARLGSCLEKLEKQLKGQGRAQARYSGTEALLRLRVEAEKTSVCERALEDLRCAALEDLR